ncbi:MAG: hypothetical protein Q7J84_05785, partial [Sulfuricaulis sp.]|nr:hypothetical protein [Sulfuricaulis sp.]
MIGFDRERDRLGRNPHITAGHKEYCLKAGVRPANKQGDEQENDLSEVAIADWGVFNAPASNRPNIPLESPNSHQHLATA